MTYGTGVGVNLIVIASNKALVSEEVNILVLGASDVLLSCNMLQAVSLIPASREDIERNLTTDGEAVFRQLSDLFAVGIPFQVLKTYVRP